MKYFFALCTGLLFAAAAFAQTSSNEEIARQATEQLKAKYSLSEAQSAEMYTIQMRKLTNIAEIGVLKDSDPALYRGKMRSIQKGTLASIQRLLDTDAQRAIFKKTQNEIRVLQGEKRKEMISQGATQEAVETALLDIYFE